MKQSAIGVEDPGNWPNAASAAGTPLVTHAGATISATFVKTEHAAQIASNPANSVINTSAWIANANATNPPSRFKNTSEAGRPGKKLRGIPTIRSDMGSL